MFELDAIIFFPGLAFFIWVMHKISYSLIRDEIKNIEDLEEKAESQQNNSLSISEEISQKLQLFQLKQNLWKQYYFVFGFQLIINVLGVLLVRELGWAWWQ